MVYVVDHLVPVPMTVHDREWEDFQKRQQDLLDERASNGWELIHVVPLIGSSAPMTEALLYYFEK